MATPRWDFTAVRNSSVVIYHDEQSFHACVPSLTKISKIEEGSELKLTHETNKKKNKTRTKAKKRRTRLSFESNNNKNKNKQHAS